MVWNVQAYRKNSPAGGSLGPYTSADAAIKIANGVFTPSIDEVLIYSPEHRDQAFLRLKSPTKDGTKLALTLEQRRRKAEAKLSSHALMTKSLVVDWTGLNAPLPDTAGVSFQAKVNGANLAVQVSSEVLEANGEGRCKEKAREKLEQSAKTGTLPNTIAITMADFTR